MKKNLSAGIFSLALLIATNAAAASGDVLANVNGRDVTKGEIETALKNVMNGQAASPPSYDKLPPDVQKAFVDKYIEKLLIIDAAKKDGLENDPEIVRKLAEAREFLIQQKYLDDLVKQNESDDKLKAIYDAKIKGQQPKEEVHAEHILVKTEDEAKKLKAQIDNGANFEDLAKSNSTEAGAKVSGGDLGYFTENQMVPEFSKVAFSLKKGQVSEPVHTEFGWHIIKVLDKRTLKVPSFAESKTALQQAAAGDVIENQVQKLKAQATIVYYGPLAKVPAAPNVLPVVKKVDGTTK